MIKYEDILKKIKYYEARKAKNDEKLAQLNEENLTLASTLKLLNQKKELLEKMESELSELIPSKKKDVAKYMSTFVASNVFGYPTTQI